MLIDQGQPHKYCIQSGTSRIQPEIFDLTCSVGGLLSEIVSQYLRIKGSLRSSLCRGVRSARDVGISRGSLLSDSNFDKTRPHASASGSSIRGSPYRKTKMTLIK